MLAFLEDVWSQNFLNYFASPLTISEYVSGLILTSIITSLAGLSLMLVLGGWAFGYNILKLGLLLMPFLSTLFLFGLALGVFATSLILRFGPSAEWLAWPIPFVLNPFVGVFYPISTLPAVLQPIAKLLPPSYVFEGMRAVIFTETFSWPYIITGFGLACVYLALAYLFFIYIYRLVLRNGLIARFSAENL
jgi:ABC-2 type transport system permease protein